MPDLIFATKGQAEAIAAQQKVREQAKHINKEFHHGSTLLDKWKDPLDRIQHGVEKSFDPMKIGKFVGHLAGVGVALNLIHKGFESIQEDVNKAGERQLKMYEAAEKSGDEHGAAQVAQRGISVKALEKAANESAKIAGQENLMAAELAAFDETMANVGHSGGFGTGYLGRTFGSLSRRAVGGGAVRRSDAIYAAESEIKLKRQQSELDEMSIDYQTSHHGDPARIAMERESFEQRKKQILLLEEMAQSLKRAENKEDGLTVTNE